MISQNNTLFEKIRKIISIVLYFLSFISLARANEVALTFDDLPAQREESSINERKINERILSTLAIFKAPAIGFVNEGKLYSRGETKQKIDILKLWVNSGHPLANHTYSHGFLSRSNLQEFQKDVIKGSLVSKKLMKEAGLDYKYFRHPYLDTGKTKEVRIAFESFLKKEGYVIAPVTINTSDYKFNKMLLKNPQDKDMIIKKYIEYTKAKFLFYQKVSEQIFARNIKHVWLLHVNLINSYALPDLLKLLEKLSYRLITLDDALKDPVYSEEYSYDTPLSSTWLYKWDFNRGKTVNWSKEPGYPFKISSVQDNTKSNNLKAK